MKYRVWCKNKNEWEKDGIAVLQNGELIQLKNMQTLRKETHIIEFMADIESIHCDVYDGDMLFYKGSNGELGYEANDDPDGIFVVEFKEGKFTVIDPWSGEIFDLDDFDFDCVIGNIHEKLDYIKRR